MLHGAGCRALLLVPLPGGVRGGLRVAQALPAVASAKAGLRAYGSVVQGSRFKVHVAWCRVQGGDGHQKRLLKVLAIRKAADAAIIPIIVTFKAPRTGGCPVTLLLK
jgi:hypothetical protein